MSTTIQLYDFTLSGHAHRVRLMLSFLDLPYEAIEVDLRNGEHKTPAFLAMTPFGQIPVIRDGDITLADSNAILVYLARRYDSADQWLPRSPLQEAQVQVWLSAAAGLLAFGPAHARAGHVFKRPIEQRAYALAASLLSAMAHKLGEQRWLASNQHPTIADVALYSYTAHAPEGGISLADYPHVQRWLRDVEGLTGFVPMPWSALPEQA